MQKNGLKRKMAIMLSVPLQTIRYDKSVGALVCTCGCGMEISTISLKEIVTPETRVYRRLHEALKAGAE